MIVEIRIETFWTSWRDLPPEGYAKIRGVLPILPEEKPEYLDPVVVDLSKLGPILGEYRLTFEVTDWNPRAAEIGRLRNEVERLRHALAAPTIINVQDMGLFTVNETGLLEDACTDELQRWLSKGWRILAICPSTYNDQRRPDYIMGRNNPNTDRPERAIRDLGDEL